MQPPILRQSPKQAQNIKQIQRLIMSQEMQQALQFLELPIMELQPLIEAELEQNPVLESEIDYPENEIEDEEQNENGLDEKELHFDERDFQIMEQLDEELGDHFRESGTTEKKQSIEDEKLKNYLDSLICQKSTLFSHLMEQSREIFESPLDLKMAEALIGNFDEHGFLKTPLKEIALLNGCSEKNLSVVLEKIKTLEPKGIGAKDLQESLLIQLSLLGKEKSAAYEIVKNCYDHLLHNRIPLIQKTLKLSENEIKKAIKDISKLDLNPALGFSSITLAPIVEDLTIKEDGDDFVIFVNEDPLPPLRLKEKYLKLLEDETLHPETKEFIQKKIASARWMLKNLTERNETLVRIAHLLVKKQQQFLKQREGKLTPLTMLQIAEELGVNESTVTRAVSNKYINTPKGLLSLRSFFSNGYTTKEGVDISSSNIKQEVQDIIKNENKKKPLSDAAISKIIEENGTVCARRTIAKYRVQLGLGTAKQRKTF